MITDVLQVISTLLTNFISLHAPLQGITTGLKHSCILMLRQASKIGTSHILLTSSPEDLDQYFCIRLVLVVIIEVAKR